MLPKRRVRIVLSGYAVCYPVGGFLSWVLQWILGLHRLGCDVYYFEKAGSWPKPCVDLETLMTTDDCGCGVSAIATLFAQHGLEGRFCFVDGSGQYFGIAGPAAAEILATADIFIEMGAAPYLDIRDTWFEAVETVPVKVFVDSEPGYTQMMIASRRAAGEPATHYDRYYSVGLGLAQSTAPLLGIDWRPIVDPVVTDLFQVVPAPPDAPFTTIMNWESHAAVEYQGVRYGQKNIEFEKFFELPGRVSVPLEIAATGWRLPLDRLEAAGWRVRDSHAATRTFDAFRSYIAESRGEFAVCKHVFVATRSGFFSDRSAAYLASGRPVVMQDTGFSVHLPCGTGLLAVNDAREAADAIEAVAGNWAQHSGAARELARACFDADVVLGGLLRDLGA